MKLKDKEQSNWMFFILGLLQNAPLKESRPEIPREKGKGRDTSDEDLLRFPMLPLYENDGATTH